MRLPISILILLVICGLSCNVNAQSEGVVRHHLYLFDADRTIDIPSNFYYMGNKVIQEVPQLNSVEDSTGLRFFASIIKYCYTDPAGNTCRVFKSFADSAQPVKCYNSIDSAEAAGGYNVYADKPIVFDSIRVISDTIRNGVRYKRMVMNEIFLKQKYVLYVYFEYGKSLSQLHFHKAHSLLMGLPAVRVESYQNNKLCLVSEFETIADRLSANESGLFGSWGKPEKCF